MTSHFPENGPDLKDFMPAAEEGATAIVGEPLPEGAAIASKTAAIEAMQEVHDPEIPINIYDLGLIYGIEIDDRGNADITMTLTAPTCPVAGELPRQVAAAVAGVEGIGVAKVTLTWTPPWNQNMMSEDARLLIGMMY
ncbi:iron-sulfur cluster assembly protein [Kiloniella sp. b19]|uniref:iron-sulfur cluster assembly protein n=1 Tax=Kiloniella sp. GXU_MW_B19 TaxID=3141326 RepID=UPI0031D00E1A